MKNSWYFNCSIIVGEQIQEFPLQIPPSSVSRSLYTDPRDRRKKVWTARIRVQNTEWENSSLVYRNWGLHLSAADDVRVLRGRKHAWFTVLFILILPCILDLKCFTQQPSFASIFLSRDLKGLSHEIFRVIFWLEWIYIGLKGNRFWFWNFKDVSSILDSNFKYWCVPYQTFSEIRRISEKDWQLSSRFSNFSIFWVSGSPRNAAKGVNTSRRFLESPRMIDN
jgi:hypothetical protein